MMRTFTIASVLFAAGAQIASAQIAVSANDGMSTLVNGATVLAAPPSRDTVTVLDLTATPPRVIATLDAPASVVGPPQSVAISPDRSLALVTAALKRDPADATKTVPDDVVSVIDLKRPAVIATLHAGRQPSGVSINAAGTLALVANRADGTVSVFTIAGHTVKPAGVVDLGARDSAPSHVVFTPDGRRALVTRNADSLVSILAVSGTTVTYTKQDVVAGSKPYGIDLTPNGNLAIVANIGNGATGGMDTISVIDLRVSPPREVSHLDVGQVPEGLAVSANGRFVAATIMNGSNAPAASPLHHDHGLLTIFRLDGTALQPVTEAPIGTWCQGVAWHPDGGSLLVQCMVDKQIRTFRFDGTRLTPGAPIAVPGGPAGLRARH